MSSGGETVTAANVYASLPHRFNGVFPGWGSVQVLAVELSNNGTYEVIADTSRIETKGNLPLKDENTSKESSSSDGTTQRKHEGLSVIQSISIAGCDLLGSCLYTAGVCTVNSGFLAPFSLLLVTILLYVFRRVYSESVTAIPVNGGTYNILLNTASKKLSSFVACLSVLSYTATAIVSAFDSMVYLTLLTPDIDIRVLTVVVLVVFAGITSLGVGESASVTLPMFSMHLILLIILVIWGFEYGFNDRFETLIYNYQQPFPDVYSSAGTLLARNSGIACLYFGYSSALLGITGFETASNYVETMRDTKVFGQTLFWMWLSVGVLNPLISLTSLMVLQLPTIYDNPSDMLAVMADQLGGPAFRVIISLDAVIILCGGVLTAFVGVTGLLQRLANDSVIPSMFGWVNRRGAPYMAVILFCLIACSLFLFIFSPTNPTAINNFGGVFAIAFLSVLAAFSCSNILLKLYRPLLARHVVTDWWEVYSCLAAVLAGLSGNIVLTPAVFYLFLAYLSGFVVVVVSMFNRAGILRFAIWMLRFAFMTKEKKLETKRIHEAVIAAAETQYQYRDLTNASGVEMLRTCGRPERSYSESKASDTITPGGSSTIDRNLLPNARSSMNPLVVFDWLDKNMRMRRSTMHTRTDPLIYDQRAHDPEPMSEIESLLRRPIVGWIVSTLMVWLNAVVSAPFVYLAKGLDPVGLHSALEYIGSNEATNVITVVHFVDDSNVITRYQILLADLSSDVESGAITRHQAQLCKRAALLQLLTRPRNSVNCDPMDPRATETQQFLVNDAVAALKPDTRQLVDLVSLMDTLYTYKQVNCLIVRGAGFNPQAVDCVSKYLHTPKNQMIMGAPDTKLPFPLARLQGVRLAIASSDKTLRDSASAHLFSVFHGLALPPRIEPFVANRQVQSSTSNDRIRTPDV